MSQERELQRTLFGIVTSLGERLSTIALLGQGPSTSSRLTLSLARQLQRTAEAAALIASAIPRIRPPD